MIHDRNKLTPDEEVSLASGSALSSPQFPIRLHDMLDQAEAQGYQHVISWLPGGNGFQIHDPEAMLPILQKYGFNQSKWKSFLRQLQNYGFRREIRGPDKGKCTHDFFVRNRRDLCLAMRRIKRSGSGENLLPSRKPRSRENLLRAGASASLNSSFSTMGSSVASLGVDSLGSHPSLSNLAFPSHDSHSRSNQNATFDFSSSRNPLPYVSAPGSNATTSRNLLAAADTQQLIWEIQNELAMLNTGSSFMQKQAVQQNQRPIAGGGHLEDLEPLDFRGKQAVEDEFSSLVEGIQADISNESMASIFLNEPTLEETYDDDNK